MIAQKNCSGPRSFSTFQLESRHDEKYSGLIMQPWMGNFGRERSLLELRKSGGEGACLRTQMWSTEETLAQSLNNQATHSTAACIFFPSKCRSI